MIILFVVCHVLFCFSARTLDKLEGHDLENITPLRQLHEAHLVAERGKGKRVVVIGTSFIGRCEKFKHASLASVNTV